MLDEALKEIATISYENPDMGVIVCRGKAPTTSKMKLKKSI